MVFSSVIFIFLFLPTVIFCYFLCPSKYLFLRNIILLIFSLAFYFYGEPKLIVIMILSIILNYIIGILVDKEQQKNRSGKGFLVFSVVANLSALVYFKYLMFFTENVNAIFGTEFIVPSIIMPIGISFYTFQAMSYVFDVYNKTAKVQKNPLNVALYVSMFPQLIAGPIVRYETVAEEINERTHSFENFSEGATRFVYGLSKKIIIANQMGLIADKVFAKPIDTLDMKLAWVGTIAYALQIFYDFAGYSDMAIGLGKIFGFTFLENFNFPYISKSITEFWRRWHMSLGTWFRDYVYIPLGGNRVKYSRQILNIFVVWFLTGFWHGASWNFIVWGLYFAVILIVEKKVLLKYLDKPFAHIYALVLILIGWVFFRSENMGYAFGYIGAMFDFGTLTNTSNQAYYLLWEYKFEWILAIIFAIPFSVMLKEQVAKYNTNVYTSVAVYTTKFVFISVCFILANLYLLNSTINPFIYFRF